MAHFESSVAVVRLDHMAPEIGPGSGYAAAVLSRIVREVYTIERHAELADLARRRMAALGYDNVHILHGDGTLGWPDHAPYDGIVVTATGPKIPEALLDQLAPGGRLVMPVGTAQKLQHLIRATRQRTPPTCRKNSVMSASCHSSVPRGGRRRRQNGLGHWRTQPVVPRRWCN